MGLVNTYAKPLKYINCEKIVYVEETTILLIDV